MSEEEKQRAKQVATIGVALLQTIREFPDGIPSGPLYAASMNVLSLEEYNFIISALKERGLITESGHFIKPTKKELKNA